MAYVKLAGPEKAKELESAAVPSEVLDVVKA